MSVKDMIKKSVLDGFSGTDIVTACKELTGRGVRKISPDQVKIRIDKL